MGSREKFNGFLIVEHCLVPISHFIDPRNLHAYIYVHTHTYGYTCIYIFSNCRRCSFCTVGRKTLISLAGRAFFELPTSRGSTTIRFRFIIILLLMLLHDQSIRAGKLNFSCTVFTARARAYCFRYWPCAL